jgi:P-type E1-E2 ATPase
MIHSVVVGDVVLFESGEIIPCDGIFLSCHNVRCDESGATGKSDTIKKLSYHKCIALRERRLGNSPSLILIVLLVTVKALAACDSRRNVKLSRLDFAWLYRLLRRQWR